MGLGLGLGLGLGSGTTAKEGMVLVLGGEVVPGMRSGSRQRRW